MILFIMAISLSLILVLLIKAGFETIDDIYEIGEVMASVADRQFVEPFSVSAYFDRIDRESQRIRDKANRKEPYLLVLWWADDGLRLNEDGTTEWISKRPKPKNKINGEFNKIYVDLDSSAIQAVISSYLIEALQPAPIPAYVSIGRNSNG